MLVELGLVEQRYQAVLEVLNDGATVTDVARRNGVARQTVHEWLRKYAAQGLAGLVDVSSRPASCPHQMCAEVEAAILELRREHPGWGPRTRIGSGRAGIAPVPGLSSIHRCLVRHGLITPQARRRKRSDYKRWERSTAMELWQMDVVGGVRLNDGCEAKIVTGVGLVRPVPQATLGDPEVLFAICAIGLALHAPTRRARARNSGGCGAGIRTPLQAAAASHDRYPENRGNLKGRFRTVVAAHVRAGSCERPAGSRLGLGPGVTSPKSRSSGM